MSKDGEWIIMSFSERKQVNYEMTELFKNIKHNMSITICKKVHIISSYREYIYYNNSIVELGR